jgi:beta-phosphoglucomutase-like phosphatase (HAD superfamily)
MMKKTILIDCDGVVFNWEYAFSLWMEEHGFEPVEGHQFMYDMGERYDIPKEQVKKLVKMFNESAMIGFLPALRDSVEYVTKMADEGWEFIAITSLSLNKYAKRLRTQNLEKLFGKGTFVKVTCLATGADKDEALSKYKDSGLWWIEDKVENAIAGEKAGLRPLVVEHGFNMDDNRIPRVKNWKEIYETVTQ